MMRTIIRLMTQEMSLEERSPKRRSKIMLDF
jgi:hypothetical protein